MNSDGSDQNNFNSTGHGTIHVPWSEDTKDALRRNSGYQQPQYDEQANEQLMNAQETENEPTSIIGFGRTVKQPKPTKLGIKRDLNNI